MDKIKMELEGYAMIQTKVQYKSSRASKITIPYEWADKNVVVILTEEP